MFEIFFDIGKYCGILSLLTIPIGLWFCIKNYKNFNYTKLTLCHLGNSKKLGSLYNLILTLFGIFEFLFSLAIINKFNLIENELLIYPLIIAALATFLAAIIPLNVNKILHDIFRYMAFIILIPWAITLHYFIWLTNLYIGIPAIIISLIMGFGTILLYIKYKRCSIPEIFFIVFVMIWNSFFSYVLFFN